jgi:adenylate cyclase
MADTTIAFADFTGSTGLYESLGNTKAAESLTRGIHWIGKLCESRGGRVIKYLGDGVLMAFADNTMAVHAMAEMQRLHHERISSWPERVRMKIKVGMARGPVVEQQGDCFGDAVNVASRLSDLAQGEQILVSQPVVGALADGGTTRFRNLGLMDIRGKAEPVEVHRVEWDSDAASEFLTMPAALDLLSDANPRAQGAITLQCLDVQTAFSGLDFPIYIGRENDPHFPVNDQRVSRMHVRIDRRGGNYVLEDLSSYGTWVRFAGSDSIIALRRQECTLSGNGEIALGASFDDFSAPCVSFYIQDAAHKAN